ncbi:MAG: hypothetical protein ACXQT6_05355 [Candidatus Methanospirareceae archaeon]|nr:hypothetical protein [Methanophagales archaeon]HDN68532.1 hypothetical protein [Methanomicrobia archaeon]
MKIENILKAVAVGVVAALVASVVLIVYSKHFVWFYLLYGAAGVGFFVLAMKILSAIQREGKQDD